MYNKTNRNKVMDTVDSKLTHIVYANNTIINKNKKTELYFALH